MATLQRATRPRLNGDGRRSHHRPYEDPVYMRFIKRVELCEQRNNYPYCEGCPTRDLCEDLLEIIAERGSRRMGLPDAEGALYHKTLTLIIRLCARSSS